MIHGKELSYSYHIHMIIINTNINYRTISYKNKVKKKKKHNKAPYLYHFKKDHNKNGGFKKDKKITPTPGHLSNHI